MIKFNKMTENDIEEFRKYVRLAFILYKSIEDIDLFRNLSTKNNKYNIDNLYITNDQCKRVLWMANDDYVCAKLIQDGYFEYYKRHEIDIKRMKEIFADEMRNIKLKSLDARSRGKDIISFDPYETKNLYS